MGLRLIDVLLPAKDSIRPPGHRLTPAQRLHRPSPHGGQPEIRPYGDIAHRHSQRSGLGVVVRLLGTNDRGEVGTAA